MFIQINLNGFVFTQELQHFVNGFFILGFFHHTELQVDTRVQHVVFFLVVCRERKRVNVDVRIYRLNLRNSIAADDIHCRFASCKCCTCIVIAVCIRIWFCIIQQHFYLFRNIPISIRKGGIACIDLTASVRLCQTNCQRIPRC